MDKCFRVVSSGGSAPVLIEKEITANGTYLAEDDSADGYSEVEVNVPAPASKLPQVVDRSILEIVADDLAGVTKIGDYAFRGCEGLTSVTIPDSVTSIETYAFTECTGLTSVTIPEGVTNISSRAFQSCSNLTVVTVPNSVTILANYAFYSCNKLTSITIGNGIMVIGNSVFQACSALTSITILAVSPPALGASALANTNDCPIYVPAASVDTYKAATNWSDFASRIQAIPS